MSAPAQLIEFFIGERKYACDLLWVREILMLPTLTPVDCAPPYCPGLIHIRGQILTAVNLEIRLGYRDEGTCPTTRCIVFKTSIELGRLALMPEDANLSDKDPVGILVDRIGDILNSPQILPAPPQTLSGLDHKCILGVIHAGTTLTTVLNIGELITPA